MIAMAHEVGLYTIVSTNAHALDHSMAKALIRSRLNRIIVSIDGFSEDSYAAYRVGGNLQKALEGLKYLRQAKEQFKSSIIIELQVLRLKTNEHEWNWIKKHYKGLGATRLVFKTAQLYDFENGNPLMPTNERYSRYRKTTNGTYIHKKSSRRISLPYAGASKTQMFWTALREGARSCYRLWSGCVITTNGDVLPCCYDKNHKYVLGNITTQTLKEIIYSRASYSLRKQILQGKHIPAMCKNCDR